MYKILIIGAHPDDPEGVAGCAVKWIKKGHSVRFLSMTNGQSGHHEYPGYKAVEVRQKEAHAVCEYLGLDGYEMLDINDGYLTTEIFYRELLMRSIRSYAPDIIITHRPFDYHPDHRCTGQLVQDCAYLIRVPNFLPTVPIPEKSPVIFYMADTFKTPIPFRADYIFDITDVVDTKLQAYSLHKSQFFEWLPWIEGIDLSTIPEEGKKRTEWLFEFRNKRWSVLTEALRPALINKYGDEKGNNINFCEAFETCEYGSPATPELVEAIFDLDD